MNWNARYLIRIGIKPLFKMRCLVEKLCLLAFIASLKNIFAIESANLSNTNSSGRLLGFILASNLDHVDPIVMILNEYVAICESGWWPELIFYTTSTWSKVMIRYAKSRSYCYRIQQPIKFRLSVHDPTVGNELASFHRLEIAKEIDNYDVFVYHEDDMILKLSNFVAYLEETNKLMKLLPETGLQDFSLGFVRYRRNLRTGEIHHAAWNDYDMIGQEVLEEEPSLTPVCLGKAAWILTREQIILLQAKCSLLNHTSSSREFMSSYSLFEKKEGSCGLTKLIPANGLSRFALYHYYITPDQLGINRQHRTPLHTLDRDLRTGHAFLPANATETENVTSSTDVDAQGEKIEVDPAITAAKAYNSSLLSVAEPPACWVDLIRISKAKFARMVAQPPTYAPTMPVPTPQPSPPQPTHLPSAPPTVKDGDLVRSSRGRQVYVVREGVLRAIPNLDTFNAMGLSFDDVYALSEKEIGSMHFGPAIPNGGG